MQRMVDNFSYAQAGVADLAGGIAMAVVTMMVTALLGMGLWAMPKMIAGFAAGPAAMSGGAGMIALGLLIHMMLSVVFGLLYAAVSKGITHEFWITGLVFGIAVWLVNFYLIGTLWTPAHMMATSEPTWLAGMTHLIFGLVTAWVASGFATRRTSRIAST